MKETTARSRETLSDSIAECLRLNIDRGTLPPGSILNKSELAKFFNVSRIPVTEAVEALADEGRLSKRSAQGHVVAGRYATEARIDTESLVMPPDLAERFDRQPSWEKIYSLVEEELVGLMPYGAFRINESAMTAHYGVNRNIIQQVITRLCDRGIAEKPSQSHCHLLIYDEDFIRHRYELRSLLEPAALVQAAPSIDRSRIIASLEAHRRVEADFARLANTWLPKLERHLHLEFLEHCPNSRFLTALSSAQVPLIATTRMIRRVLGSEVEEPLLAEHVSVLTALADGDADAAGVQLRRHLESSAERSVERLAIFPDLAAPEIPPFLRPR